MAGIRRKNRDRLFAGYDNEYERLAFGEKSVESENMRSGMRELAAEFREVFGISNSDEMPLSQRIKGILDSIRVDGESYNFLRPGSWIDDEAAMACAMARIKRMAVYGQNPKSKDGVYHIVYRDPESNQFKALGNGIYDIEIPPKPEPPRRKFFFTDLQDSDRYEREMAKYNDAVREQKRIDAIKRNNEKYIEEAEKEAESVNKANEHGENGAVRNMSIHDLMADKNGSKGSLKQRLEDANSYTRRNSKEYNEFLKSLDNVNKLWEMPNTKENTKAMLHAYERLEKACKAYLDKNSSPRRTDMGEQRIDIVRDVLNLQRREKKELEGYYNTFAASPEERILGDCVEKARYVELNEKDYKLGRIGAGTSVRLHIEGKNINGIFTEEKAEKFIGFEGIIMRNLQNAKKIPQSVAGKICSYSNCATKGCALVEIHKEDDVYKFLTDNNIIKKNNNEAEKQQWKQFAENLSADFKEMRKNKTYNAFNAVKVLNRVINEYAPAEYKDVLKRYNDSYRFFNAISSRDVSMEVKLQYLSERNVCSRSDIKKGSPARKELEQFLTDVTLETNSQRIAERTGIDSERRIDLNTRNIATSVLAELIGCPSVVAKTEKATVVTADGKTREGIFMEYVKGKEGGDLDFGASEKMAMDQKPNGGLKKKIADLQVLDSLCGQTDRHLNNIMFQTDEDGLVSDIKGIDNDMSFGVTKLNASGCHNINLGAITHIDETTANNIRNLNKEILEYKMKDLLVQKEIDSLWDRVRVMQAWLNDPRVTIVPTDEWKNKEWGELAKGVTNEVEVNVKGKIEIRQQADLHNSNLFYKVGLRTLPEGRLYMCAPQNDNDKRDYLRGIHNVKVFENEKLAEIREIDNRRQTPSARALSTQDLSARNPSARTMPVRTPSARTSGGMGMG